MWLTVSFWLVPWLSVTLLLSLKLEFIFYKLEWNVFVFQVIISILLGCRLRLMKWAHQTVRCTNEAVRAGWLVPFAVRHLLKWQAGNKGPLATRESSVLLWSGQDNRAERWPGLLATCQLVSTTHRGNRAQRSMRGGGGGEDKSEGEGERGGQWLTPACAWVLYSMLDISSIHSGWKWKIGGDYTNVQVCTCRQTHAWIQNRGDTRFVNGIYWCLEVQVMIQMCFYRSSSRWNGHTAQQSTVLFYLGCWGINQFRPHMKPRLFVLCYLLLQWNNH